jgi:hypothetical protein
LHRICVQEDSILAYLVFELHAAELSNIKQNKTLPTWLDSQYLKNLLESIHTRLEAAVYRRGDTTKN